MASVENVHLVGILNVTPNSFHHDPEMQRVYDEANRNGENGYIAQARHLIDTGADWIDIGAEATNPKALPVRPKKEWERLRDILPDINRASSAVQISIDTYNAQTASRALAQGDFAINDVMTFRDQAMIDAVKQYKQPKVIISHSPKGARTIQEVHQYKIETVEEVLEDLKETRRRLVIEHGINPERIILDPGIGFGKSMKLNWDLLRFAGKVGGAVMIGASHKRFLGTKPTTGQEVPNSDEVRHSDALQRRAARIAIGARSSNEQALYLRVHNVGLIRELLDSGKV